MPFALDKYSIAAIIIILLILLYGLYYWYYKADKKDKKNHSKKKNKKKKKARDDDNDEENDNIYDDAKELHKLIHTEMCNGMQKQDFEQTVGDLANGVIFIELKQMYNECADRKLDPMRTITVDDYYRILKKENT
jgi:FtsZ-interacting cell division protein ZipA